MVGKLRITGGGEASRNVPWDWKTLGGGGRESWEQSKKQSEL